MSPQQLVVSRLHHHIFLDDQRIVRVMTEDEAGLPVVSVDSRILRAIIQASRNRFHKSWWILRVALETFLGFVVVVILAVVSYMLPWLKGLMTTNIETGIIVLVIAIAFGLYFLRKYWRFSYAIVELFAGVWVILLAVNNLPQDVTLHIHDAILVKLCAGLYVIIRAFDNISQSKAYDGVRAEGARMDTLRLEKRIRRQQSRGAVSTEIG